MEKAEGPGPGDWWAAELDVLPDAAVVNFVVQYYEHFDNNEGQDYKAVVEHQGGGCARCVLRMVIHCEPPDMRPCFSCPWAHAELPSRVSTKLMQHLPEQTDGLWLQLQIALLMCYW